MNAIGQAATSPAFFCVSRFLRVLSILALSLSCGLVFAQTPDVEFSPFSLRGFGTFGVARSTNADAEFLRSVLQPRGISNRWTARDDAVFGLQTNYRFNSATEVVVQGVSHYRYDASYRPALTWAFVKYDLNPRLSFRLGRIGTEFLMQSDSRMVGYAYLPVRPNVDFFGALPINYGDGADVQVRWPLGDGVLRGGGFAGVAREALPGYDLDGSRMLKGSFGYDQGPWQMRYIYAQARLANDIPFMADLRNALTGMSLLGFGPTPAAAARSLGLAGNVSRYQSFGVSSDDGALQAQFALSSIRHDYVLFDDSQSGYVLAGYRIGRVSPFIGYSWGRSKTKALNTGLSSLANPTFAAINAGVTNALMKTHLDGHTVSLGARWDFARNMDIKAQVDFVNGDPSSVISFKNVAPGWDGKTTVFSVALDFVF